MVYYYSILLKYNSIRIYGIYTVVFIFTKLKFLFFFCVEESREPLLVFIFIYFLDIIILHNFIVGIPSVSCISCIYRPSCMVYILVYISHHIPSYYIYHHLN